MKYYHIYEIGERDEFLIGTTDDIFEACAMARDAWDRLTPHDQKHNQIEIRHYLYDIEDENCECFDYNIASEAWYYWFAVLLDEEDCDHGYGSFDWFEALNMADELYDQYPSVQIATVDYRDDYCIECESYEDIKRNREEF